MSDSLFTAYRLLLSAVDDWFARCVAAFPAHISCSRGCSECCRGLFDITLLDALYLRRGFDLLPAAVRAEVASRALPRLAELERQAAWFTFPYILNVRTEEEWEPLMPDDDETPCPLLSPEGRCLVYDHRPMTCRLHGLPLVDISGEVFHDEWCTLNFAESDPLSLPELRFSFNELFRDELLLFRELAGKLFGEPLSEIDTFIPAAVHPEFSQVDWQEWLRRHPEAAQASGGAP